MFGRLLNNSKFVIGVCATFALAFIVLSQNDPLKPKSSNNTCTTQYQSNPQALQPSFSDLDQNATSTAEANPAATFSEPRLKDQIEGYSLDRSPNSSDTNSISRSVSVTPSTGEQFHINVVPPIKPAEAPPQSQSGLLDLDSQFSGSQATEALPKMLSEQSDAPLVLSDLPDLPDLPEVPEVPERIANNPMPSLFGTPSASPPAPPAITTPLATDPVLAIEPEPKAKSKASAKSKEPKAPIKTKEPKEPKKPAPKKKPPGPPQDSNSLNPSNFRLAGQPELGHHFHPHLPETDKRSWLVEPEMQDFHPGPYYENLPYDPYPQQQVYEGKTLNATQRPLLELGEPFFQLGQVAEGKDFFGFHNQFKPQLLAFGDFRTAYASNNNVDGSDSQLAFEWNLNLNLQLTSTERFAAFVAPLNKGENNTRLEFDNDRYQDEFNADFLFGYFEGDLGAIIGGATGQTLPFDLPFAVGVLPLLFQNGVWLEDQFLGAAFTIPAQNSPKLDISNMDITFFFGFDEITSAAFDFEDDVAKLYGIATFIEATNGYWEIDYAYIEDRNLVRDRSYHNIGIGFTRRYGHFLSNSTRVIVNAGQSTEGGPNTADGVLLLSENSLITAFPSTIVPYLNMFAGFDRPQKAAGANVLRNTGILFESDGLTGYPTLDDTARNTFGGALGINILPRDFSQQLVLETAYVGVMGDAADRFAQGDQYGLGARYQLPLNNSTILRADAMIGFLRNSEDIRGARIELRKKF